MQLILLGSPGSGKGTQAEILSKTLSIPHISTGNILRKEIADKTPLGNKVAEIMNSGHLISDELMLEVLSSRLSQVDCNNGFILDGFPRNDVQAKNLDDLLEKLGKKISLVINLHAPLEEITRRLSGRRTCMKCGSISNVFVTNEQTCPKCAGELLQREDDKPKNVKTRLQVYENQTKPLIKYYEKMGLLKTVDANSTPGKVNELILKELKN